MCNFAFSGQIFYDFSCSMEKIFSLKKGVKAGGSIKC